MQVNDACRRAAQMYEHAHLRLGCKADAAPVEDLRDHGALVIDLRLQTDATLDPIFSFLKEGPCVHQLLLYSGEYFYGKEEQYKQQLVNYHRRNGKKNMLEDRVIMRRLMASLSSFLGFRGSTLTVLDLTGIPIGKLELVTPLCRSLSSATQLNRIILANCKLGDAGLKSLIPILTNLRHLHAISLAHNCLTQPGLVAQLLRARWSRGRPTKTQATPLRPFSFFDLSGNPRLVKTGTKRRGDLLVRSICEILRDGFALKRLVLNGLGLMSGNLRPLLALINDATEGFAPGFALERVDLVGNTQVARELVDAINEALESLAAAKLMQEEPEVTLDKCASLPLIEPLLEEPVKAPVRRALSEASDSEPDDPTESEAEFCRRKIALKNSFYGDLRILTARIYQRNLRRQYFPSVSPLPYMHKQMYDYTSAQTLACPIIRAPDGLVYSYRSPSFGNDPCQPCQDTIAEEEERFVLDTAADLKASWKGEEDTPYFAGEWQYGIGSALSMQGLEPLHDELDCGEPLPDELDCDPHSVMDFDRTPHDYTSLTPPLPADFVFSPKAHAEDGENPPIPVGQTPPLPPDFIFSPKHEHGGQDDLVGETPPVPPGFVFPPQHAHGGQDDLVGETPPVPPGFVFPPQHAHTGQDDFGETPRSRGGIDPVQTPPLPPDFVSPMQRDNGYANDVPGAYSPTTPPHRDTPPLPEDGYFYSPRTPPLPDDGVYSPRTPPLPDYPPQVYDGDPYYEQRVQRSDDGYEDDEDSIDAFERVQRQVAYRELHSRTPAPQNIGQFPPLQRRELSYIQQRFRAGERNAGLDPRCRSTEQDSGGRRSRLRRYTDGSDYNFFTPTSSTSGEHSSESDNTMVGWTVPRAVHRSFLDQQRRQLEEQARVQSHSTEDAQAK